MALARRRICRARTPPGVTGPLFFSIVNVFFFLDIHSAARLWPSLILSLYTDECGRAGKKIEGKPHSSSSSSSFFSDVMATLALYYTTVAVLRTLICFKLGGLLLLLQPLPCAFPYLVVNAPLRFFFFLFFVFHSFSFAGCLFGTFVARRIKMWTMGETSIHFHVFSWGPENKKQKKKERKKMRDFYFWVFLECGATSTRLREPGRP